MGFFDVRAAKKYEENCRHICSYEIKSNQGEILQFKDKKGFVLPFAFAKVEIFILGKQPCEIAGQSSQASSSLGAGGDADFVIIYVGQ